MADSRAEAVPVEAGNSPINYNLQNTFMKKKLDQFVESLEGALGSELQSVVLYGPACGALDRVHPEEVQVLVLCHTLSVKELQLLVKPLNRWMKNRHPIPKLFTLERLKKSTDVFPIECLEIKTRHEVLFGENVMDEIEVDKSNLRLQLETEFKGKLLQLRESFIILQGRPKELTKMMVVSLGAFESLFRSLVSFLGEDSSQPLHGLLKVVEEKFSIDGSVFGSLEKLRISADSITGSDVVDLFSQYLKVLELISDKVDSL